MDLNGRTLGSLSDFWPGPVVLRRGKPAAHTRRRSSEADEGRVVRTPSRPQKQEQAADQDGQQPEPTPEPYRSATDEAQRHLRDLVGLRENRSASLREHLITRKVRGFRGHVDVTDARIRCRDV